MFGPFPWHFRGFFVAFSWPSKFRGVDKRVVCQKGGFGRCSPGTKIGTRVHSDVFFGTKTGTRVRSHVAPERKQERGHIGQNHPFAKPPFCLLLISISPLETGRLRPHRGVTGQKDLGSCALPQKQFSQ